MVDKPVDRWSEEFAADSQHTEGESLGTARDSKPEFERDMNIYKNGVVNAEPNDDVYRTRISKPIHGLKKILRLVKHRITPPPTAEEIAQMEDKKRAKLLEKTLKGEAAEAARRLSNSLADLGFCHFKRDQAGNASVQKRVRFDVVYSTEDAHWLHVDTRRWVPGVNSQDIIDQKVINHLSFSVGHKVNIRATAEDGIWYIIERASGMMGIPVHVTISDIWQRFPSTAHGLTVPIGLTNNRKTVFDDIDEMVHILVAGQTGAGKSNLLNVWLTTLITRNSPDTLRLVLMDMKAGLEFQYYEGLPHLLPVPGVSDTGIIDNPDRVAPALTWIVKHEAAARLSTIRAAGHKDIKGYNTRRRNPMPRMVVCIDEWAMARMADGGKDAELELAKAVQLLRAAGIHFIIGTQTPSKDVLGVLVRANLPTRIALSCAELSASMLIVGDGSAVGLGNPGRCIFKKHAAQPVQTPYISELMVRKIVEEVIAGQIPGALAAAKHDVTLDEMLAWALHENSGSLRYQTVYNHFAHRGIPRLEVQTVLADLENKTVTINGVEYLVQPGAGSRPRKLVAVQQTESQGEVQNETHS